MAGRIMKDEQEFLDIVRGKLRKDLRRYLQTGQIKILGPGRGVAIPVEFIEIPRLHFAPIQPDAEVQEEDSNGTSTGPDLGVGEGPGDPGTDLGPVTPSDGDGKGEEKRAGIGRGPEIIEVEIPPEDIYELFKEVLMLPNIKPKGGKNIKTEQWKYTDIRPFGPKSLLHKKRTLKQALKRTVGEGGYNPDEPTIVPFREDMRFRIPESITKPRNNAVIINMMDVSGSVTRTQRAVIRYFCSLCEFWLTCNYESVETVWIIHDGEADRVTREVFFSTQRGGGTVISSAHKKMLEVMREEYPPAQWNIYPMYFSDGFNIGDYGEIDDNQLCAELIRDEILPCVNQYFYGEVRDSRPWWNVSMELSEDPSSKFQPAGNFGKMLAKIFKTEPLVIRANLKTAEEVPNAIREAFGQGQ